MRDIVKSEDIQKRLNELVNKFPWESNVALFPLAIGELVINIHVMVPHDLALMEKLTNKIPDECKVMKINIWNDILFEGLDFYSDIYKQFTLYMNFINDNGDVILTHEARIYNRLKEEISMK